MPQGRNSVRLLAATARYMERIQNEGQSPTTIRTARAALNRFQRSVATARRPNPYVHEITREEVDDYCYGPTGIRRGIKAISFNRYRSILQVFFEYCLTMRWTDINPMDAIGRARPDAPTTKLYLGASELLGLLDHAANPVERIALSLGMNTGMRGNDIRHLTIFDANLGTGVIQTEIRKTRKLDVKPITMELHWELSRWFETYAALMECEVADLKDEWVLMPAYRNPAPNERRREVRLNPTDVHGSPWRLIQRPLARAGFPTKGEGFHTLRRSSARALFESMRHSGEGRDHALMVVKEFLNHSSVMQTEHYLGLNQERAIRDVLLKDRPFLSQLVEHEQARGEDVRRFGAGGT
jgi:integrase